MQKNKTVDSCFFYSNRQMSYHCHEQAEQTRQKMSIYDKPTKILIVNDSNVLTAVIRATVETQPGLQVVATAMNGEEAVQQSKRHLPDLILMDIHMPKMNGIEATRQIIRSRPKSRILITSATITRNMRHIFEALQHGAVDYVRSPSLNFSPGTAVSEQQLLQAGDALLKKIRLALKISTEKLQQQNRGSSPKPQRPSLPTPTQPPALRMLAIGASTGGPTAVAALLQRLQQPFPAPIIVCLHMDAEFTEGFVHWLSDQSGLPCSIARPKQRPQNGHVYIAPGGKQNLELDSRLQFQLTSPQSKQYFLPNINQLFSSIARAVGKNACGVVMTGMGDDGAAGLQQMQQAGAMTLAQDEQSATIDSMPRAARVSTHQTQGYPPAQLATCINAQL